MNRVGLLLVRGLLDAIALVFVAYVFMLILSVRSMAGPDPEAVLAKAQPVFEQAW